MKKITLLAAVLMSAASFAQIATTSFENPAPVAGQYTDTGDANVAHDLINNAGEPSVDFTSTGDELGFNASYSPYDAADVGLTDGDFVGVTDFTPSPSITYTDGTQGYQISDVDGNFTLEFDQVDLTGASTPNVSIDYLLSINDDGSNGNFEGDGTENSSGSDRIRIYVRDITNNTEIDIVNSTGIDIDDLVPVDGGTGNFIEAWQTGEAILLPNTMVQLVIEVRCNASGEAFFFDNVVFSGILNNDDVNASNFSIFPNPANDFINITTQNQGAVSVSIFDVLGKQVIATQNSNRLNISSLNSGVYLVQLTQGDATTTKKLIVK